MQQQHKKCVRLTILTREREQRKVKKKKLKNDNGITERRVLRAEKESDHLFLYLSIIIYWK